MMRATLRLLPHLLLVLQLVSRVHGSAANSLVDGPISGSPLPSATPYSDRVVTQQAAEAVEQAFAILHRLDDATSRSSRSASGLLSTTWYYAKELLPSLHLTGPPTDSNHQKHVKETSLRGPLADAVALLKHAAEDEHPDAIYMLAQMNFYGNFTHPRNLTEAFHWYSDLASLNGNSSAQHMLGFMYSTGIGDVVERDQAKALLYHTFAAEAGHTKSEMTVAFRHHTGIGAPRDCDQAAKYYKRVADKAIEWFRSGPPGGRAWVPDSYRLADDEGGVYGEGASASSAGPNANHGGPNSDANAALDDVLEYLDLMSRKGDFKATFTLGRLHYEGQRGLGRNMKKARQYFHLVTRQYWTKDGRIIEQDRPGLEKTASKAAGYLGKMYLRGEGVEENYENAFRWFQRGIKNGDAGSQYGLGLMYLHGLSVPKNSIKAAEYFKAAADQDYSAAQVGLGALHLDQGQASDIQIASRYFELATRYGNLEAFYYLAELSNKGVGRDRTCNLATAYYKTVAEKCEPFLSSFAEANEAYESGNEELALIDYMMAAEQGYEKAQANVAFILDQEKSRLPLFTSKADSRPALLKNAALALIYWTRSAKQTNIDSIVKMGDYYLGGIGTEVDYEKAAACYSAASEFHQSAQALYNLGWMHENGVGLTQDFHLAKRFYDQALEANDEAYLPVTLSLLKLRLRSAWNTLTNGRINSIRDEPTPQKQWSLGEWITNFLRDDHPYYGDGDYDDRYLGVDDTMPGGDADGFYDDVIEDTLIESLVIFGLASALLFLIYYRQQRQLAHRRRREENAARQGGHEIPQVQREDRGFFPAPGDPEFDQWRVGAIGL